MFVVFSFENGPQVTILRKNEWLYLSFWCMARDLRLLRSTSFTLFTYLCPKVKTILDNWSKQGRLPWSIWIMKLTEVQLNRHWISMSVAVGRSVGHVTWLCCQLCDWQVQIYRKTSNISRTLVGNKIVDHPDVVGASPVGAVPTTSSFSTWHLASRDSSKTAAR